MTLTNDQMIDALVAHYTNDPEEVLQSTIETWVRERYAGWHHDDLLAEYEALVGDDDDDDEPTCPPPQEDPLVATTYAVDEARVLFRQTFSERWINQLFVQNARFPELLWQGFARALKLLTQQQDQLRQEIYGAMNQDPEGRKLNVTELDLSKVEERTLENLGRHDSQVHQTLHVLALASAGEIEVDDGNVLDVLQTNCDSIDTASEAREALIRADLQHRFPRSTNLNTVVCWEIDMCGLSPVDAAKKAHEQYVNTPGARVYKVFDEDGNETVVDMDELENPDEMPY